MSLGGPPEAGQTSQLAVEVTLVVDAVPARVATVPVPPPAPDPTLESVLPVPLDAPPELPPVPVDVLPEPVEDVVVDDVADTDDVDGEYAVLPGAALPLAPAPDGFRIWPNADGAIRTVRRNATRAKESMIAPKQLLSGNAPAAEWFRRP